jgi:hypothetical protein
MMLQDAILPMRQFTFPPFLPSDAPSWPPIAADIVRYIARIISGGGQCNPPRLPF